MPGQREGGAQGEAAADPLRDVLLDAAARVFARKGYDGTKILDIVAEAILRADRVRTEKFRPFYETAIRDGLIDPSLDPVTVLFLVRTLYLGLLLQRAAQSVPPDAEAWEAVVRRITGAVAPGPVATTSPD